jgi:hypothetical protein
MNNKLILKLKNMKNILDWIKNYNTYILIMLLVITTFRSCNKSSTIKKMEKIVNKSSVENDSLINIMIDKQIIIDNFPETIRLEKIKLHNEYDNWISSKDRGKQLMELHSIIKNNIKELEK